MTTRITIIEKKNAFNTLEKSHIEIGIIENKFHSVDGDTGVEVSMVDVARSNESIFGFMSYPKIDFIKTRLEKITDLAIKSLVTRGKKSSKLEKEAEEIIKKPMRTGEYHNTPATIKRKGFDKGTIETWLMYENIKAIFVKDSSVKSKKKIVINED